MSNTSIDSIRRVAIFASVVLAIFVLYVGRELLIPLSLAILISFLLKPVVTRLVSWRIPKGVAVLIATGLTAAIFIGMILFLSSQVVDLTSKLPDYKSNLTTKFTSIKNSFDAKFGKIPAAFKDMAATKPATPAGTPAAPETASAVPAAKPANQETNSSFDFVSIAGLILDPILTPITQTGVVFILVCFMLIDADVVSRRLHWIGEHWRLGIPVDATDEALKKVGGYLRTQLLINLGYGAIIGIALTFIGLPNAILWGALSAVLRYVPFVGAWIAASLPIALSIAIFPGWTQAGLVIGAYVVAEAITYGVLEPMLFGHSTGVSSIGVVIATFFWGWLWGPVGLILAMPMTACLVVIGRHIPLLRTFSVLLSSDTIETADSTTPDPTKPFDVTSYILKMR